MADMREIRRGDRFVHARQLDPGWRPGPGQRYTDAPHRVCVVTSVQTRCVWYAPDGGHKAAWFADPLLMQSPDDGIVREWLPARGGPVGAL